jgi:hypothetical protein
MRKRASPWQRERRRRRAAERSDRKCSRCPALLPVGRHCNLCALCKKKEDFLRYGRARPCSGQCGTLLPAGQCDNRCAACRRAYRDRQKERVQRCSQCRGPVPKGWTNYLCRDCNSMESVARNRGRRRTVKHLYEGAVKQGRMRAASLCGKDWQDKDPIALMLMQSEAEPTCRDCLRVQVARRAKGAAMKGR